MRFDAHHHFWNPEDRDYPWMEGAALDPIRRPFGPDDLRDALSDAGIEGTVLVQTVASLAETEEFLRIAEETDVIKGVVGWADLTDDLLSETLDHLKAGTGGGYLKGIRHQAHDEPDDDWLARPDVITGVGICGAHGLVQDLLVKEPQMPASITLVDVLPEVRFVLDHIAKPRIADGAMEPWQALITELARRENVTCKLSGMITEADWNTWSVEDLAPYVDTVLEAFGPSRVMFGSDWPVCLLAGTYQQVVSAADTLTSDLSASERALVFGGTAARVYGLEA